MNQLQKAVICYKKFIELQKILQEVEPSLQCITETETENLCDFGRSLQISVGLLLLNETNDPANLKNELQKIVNEL